MDGFLDDGVGTDERLAALRLAYARFGSETPERLVDPAWALLAPLTRSARRPATPGGVLAAADALAQAVLRERPGTAWAALAGDLREHVAYVADRAGIPPERVGGEAFVMVEPLVLSDALHNIGHVAAELWRLSALFDDGPATAAAALAGGASNQRAQYIGGQRLMVTLPFGRLVVPGWNLDVGVGIIRDGVIEPWTNAAVRALLKPGATYVNVGANFGYYTVLGAHCVGRAGRVVAVEANPYLVPDLMRSVFASGYPDLVRFYQCAISDESGRTLRLTFDPQFIGGGSIQRNDDPCVTSVEGCFWDADKVARMKTKRHEIKKWPGFYTAVDVVTETLDVLLAEMDAVDLLHMDVEGCEPAAILGAAQVIRRSKDLSVVMEWSPNYAALPENQARVRGMWELLRAEGFAFHAIIPAAMRGDEPFPQCRPIPDLESLLQTGHGDLVCLKPPVAAALGLV